MAEDLKQIEVPTYICKRVNVDFPLDGVWNKWPWMQQSNTEPFRQFSGRDCVQRTYAKMCWNIKYFYVAFLCTDDDVWGSYRNHDDPIYEEDVVEVFMAPHGVPERGEAGEREPTTYYEVEVSPHNVTFDVKVTNTTGTREAMQTDRAWRCEGLRSAVQVKGVLDDLSTKDQYWSCEIAMPWAALGIEHPTLHSEMPINLYRIDRDRRKNRGGDEYQCWSPTLTPRADNHVPGRFGMVGFA